MSNTSGYPVYNTSSNISGCDDTCWNSLWAFWVEGVAIPLVAIFGIIGNIGCVFVFNHKSVDLKPSFSNILKCLSIYDIALLLGMLLLYGLPTLSSSYTVLVKPHLMPIVLPLVQVSLTGSVYSVVVVSIERYSSVCRPFSAPNPGRVCKGGGYIAVVVIFSFLANVTKFLEFETVWKQEEANSSWVAKMQVTALRRDPLYHTLYTVTNTLVMGVLPILSLAFLNTRIVQAMAEATKRHNTISTTKRRDSAMSALLTGVVVVLVVCHTPKTAINIFESYHIIRYGKLHHEPLWNSVIIKLSHLLLTLSSAINIVIYSCKDFKFRIIISSFLKKSSIVDRISLEETGNDNNANDETTTCV